jgi:endoglucanase
MTSIGYLRISGNQLVDAAGSPVILRGFGLGGWLNMENFITGYPSSEQAQRQAILKAVGPDNYRRFFERLLGDFFAEGDADFIKSLGLNLVRIPINYRHLEDDMRPFVTKDEGFHHIDRAVSLCAERGIYTILDLHALPGGQNQAWHSDNATHKALFWEHRHFQERANAIWRAIAARYKGNPWVAGYNPINEPADPSESYVADYYDEIVAEIRAVDPDHVIFLEGNCYSRDFFMFKKVIPNVVYTNHDYALPGFVDGGPYPGVSRGRYVDRQALRDTFLQRSEFMLSRGLPIWVGEFGPVYTGDAEKDAMRYRVLEDQLEIYDEYDVSWAIWTYKDIGLQGLCFTRPDSAWNAFVRPITEKKARLGADRWGNTDEHIRHVTGPIEALMDKEFPGYNPFPSGVSWQICRLVREILFAEALVPEFGKLFEGLSERQLDELASYFHLSKCAVRDRLVGVLKAHARRRA